MVDAVSPASPRESFPASSQQPAGVLRRLELPGEAVDEPEIVRGPSWTRHPSIQSSGFGPDTKALEGDIGEEQPYLRGY